MATSTVTSRMWHGTAIALLVLACAGSAGRGATVGVSGSAATTPPASTTPTTAVACPHASAVPIAGVSATVLPCLTDPDNRVAIGAASGRPEVINVWASWCGPCRREAPVLEAAYRAVGDRVLFVGVDSQDERDAALRFLAGSRTTYPQVYDADAGFARALGAVGMPYTVIVDADGAIAYRQIGALTAQALRSGLARVGAIWPGPG